jgi:hypothetical protein
MKRIRQQDHIYIRPAQLPQIHIVCFIFTFGLCFRLKILTYAHDDEKLKTIIKRLYKKNKACPLQQIKMLMIILTNRKQAAV